MVNLGYNILLELFNKLNNSNKILNKQFFMAKQSMIQREKKREKLVLKYREKRDFLLFEFKTADNFLQQMEIRKKIEKLPRNSSRIRLRNRCWRTGRSRGVYRDFGLCRHIIREMAHNCLLPGVRKASW